MVYYTHTQCASLGKTELGKTFKEYHSLYHAIPLNLTICQKGQFDKTYRRCTDAIFFLLLFLRQMPSKRYKQVQMRFDNIGLCCFGSCLSLLSSTLTHVHTLNTAQALQYKYKYADESKYIQTCLEFAQFSAHSLYLVEMKRAGYPI